MERGIVLHKNGAGTPAVNTQSNDQNLLWNSYFYSNVLYAPSITSVFFRVGLSDNVLYTVSGIDNFSTVNLC
jgi:hypothetical protein